jgi:hypothetical protein
MSKENNGKGPSFNKLMSCPFCGEEATLIDMTADKWGNPFQIHCHTEWCLGDTAWYPKEAKDELIKRWNTRDSNKAITAESIIEEHGENYACRLIRELELLL